MSWELHHRKSDNKYAIWSTILDDYNTSWMDMDNLKLWYIGYECQVVMDKADKFFEDIDKEV